MAAHNDVDDTLSFCDFALYNDDDDDNYYSSPRKYSDASLDVFEFLIDPDFELDSSTRDSIIFCGKTINTQAKLFTRDPHNGLFQLVKTNSFKRSNSLKSSSINLAAKPSLKSTSPSKSASCRFQTATKSRKHKLALIGSLSKPQPKMVLSDIKKRQGKLARPAPLLFPVSEEAAAVVDVVRGSGTHNKSSRMLRPLWCRAHFVSALMKASFGCIPSPRPVNGHASCIDLA